MKTLYYIFLLSCATCTILGSGNAVSQEKILSPKPPAPALSTSLPPQQSMLPAAPGNLKIKQGYYRGKDSVQLFYRIVGSGKDTVVFVHGGPGLSMEDGALNIEMLAKKGYTFIAYDQRGGGRSELVRDTTKLLMDDQIEDLEAMRRQFKIQKLSLIGLSWGAAIIACYSNRFPQHVNCLVFISPMPPTTGYAIKRWIAFDSAIGEVKRNKLNYLDSMMSHTTDDTAYRALSIMYFSTGQSAYLTDSSHSVRERGSFATLPPLAVRNRSFHSITRYLGNPWDIRDVLIKIKAPALILEGEKTNVPLEATREYINKIKGSQLILIPDAGHQNWLDQPEAVLNALDQFFKSVPKHTP